MRRETSSNRGQNVKCFWSQFHDANDSARRPTPHLWRDSRTSPPLQPDLQPNAEAKDYGVDLMRAAFKADAESPLSRAFEIKAEREAASHLFAGAIGLLKNPSSHREVDLVDPVEVADILRLADLLLHIVDRAAASEGT
jgi:hypothetical protein